jgi:hypothetical protein
MENADHNPMACKVSGLASKAPQKAMTFLGWARGQCQLASYLGGGHAGYGDVKSLLTQSQ